MLCSYYFYYKLSKSGVIHLLKFVLLNLCLVCSFSPQVDNQDELKKLTFETEVSDAGMANLLGLRKRCLIGLCE